MSEDRQKKDRKRKDKETKAMRERGNPRKQQASPRHQAKDESNLTEIRDDNRRAQALV